MRRQEREVTDPQQIRALIAACACCRLGFYDEGEVYIVPLHFGYEERDGRRLFYFHGAREGRKMALIRQQPLVGFELDIHHAILEGDTACRYSAAFESIIGTGRVSLMEEREEKRRALRVLMRHQTGRDDWDFSDAMVDGTAVFRMDVQKLSCKASR